MCKNGYKSEYIHVCYADWGLNEVHVERAISEFEGKNTLNFFRQDHGYKEGTYIKQWHGEEDNEVLAKLVTSLDAGADDFQQQLYQALEENYPN